MLYCFTSYLLMHILFVSVNNKVVVLPYHRKTKALRALHTRCHHNPRRGTFQSFLSIHNLTSILIRERIETYNMLHECNKKSLCLQSQAIGSRKVGKVMRKSYSPNRQTAFGKNFPTLSLNNFEKFLSGLGVLG